MEFECMTEKLPCERYGRLGEKQTQAEIHLDPEPGTSVDRILLAEVRPSVGRSECVRGEIRFFGRAECMAVYADAEGKIRRTTASAEFSDRLESDRANPASEVGFECATVDLTCSQAGEGIRLSATFETVVFLREREELTSAVGCDSLIARCEETELMRITACGTKTLIAEEEFEHKGQITEICCSDFQADLSGSVPAPDTLIAEGTGYLTLTYFDEETQSLEHLVRDFPIREEIEFPGCGSADLCALSVSAVRHSLALTPDEESKTTTVRLEAELCLRCKCFESASCRVCADAFSPTHRLDCRYEEKEVTVYEGSVHTVEKVEGSSVLPEEMREIYRLIAVCASSAAVTGARAEDGRLLAEGVIRADLLYDDDEGNKHGVAVEVPFALSADSRMEADEIEARAVVTEIYARNRGREIDLFATLSLRAEGYSQRRIRVLCGAEAGEELRPEFPMSVYFAAPGEPLFEACKALGASEQTLRAQNGDLPERFEREERVVCYRGGETV